MKRKRQIEEMLQTIRNRGGIVSISEGLPDQTLESFLQQILDCPDCKENARRASRVPESRSEH